MIEVKSNLWNIVEQTYNKSDLCYNCDYSTHWKECHPYGDTVACEDLFECNLEDIPEKCPGVQQFLDEAD